VARIRVLLAEDHHVVRTAFAALLSKEPDIDVIGEVADAAALLDMVSTLEPDVLLLDAHMPGGQVIAGARTIREQHPRVRILVLSAYDRREYVVGLVRAGAAGYVLKHDSSDVLIHAVRAVARGEEWISPRVAEVLVKSIRYYDESPSARLTEREIDVLRLMASGYTNSKIAEALVITNQTVKNHIRKIFRKLGVETRVDAVLYALNQELEAGVEDLEEKE
jgi:DNA-binding NarL/FixJ family response regulator